MTATSFSLKKSTNVRFWIHPDPWQQLLYRLLPGPSSAALTRRFLTPWRRLSPLPRDGAAQAIELTTRRTSVSAYVWGSGPVVILSHGWSGGAGQLLTLRDRLVQAGYTVAAFDAPAHGGSAGRATNVGEFTHCIEELARRLGHVHAIVGHSLGGMAAALASARSAQVQGLVMLAPMPSFDFAFDEFQRLAGFDDSLRERITTRVERIAGVSRDQGSLDRLLTHSAPTLIIHDAEDRRIPVAHSRGLAAHFAHVQYLETRGLGHKRVLDDASVAARVVEFIAQLPAPAVNPIDRTLARLPEFSL